MPTTSRQPGIDLAYELLAGAGPAVVFCPGFNSDMRGTKAQRLWDFCAANGRAMLRFDYAGHGASAGAFTDGGIGDWTADAAHIIETALPGRDLILVGSSMGGWISLLLGPNLGPRLRGLILIAPAPDFTERLMKPALTAAQKAALEAGGVFHQPSPYGPPTPITAKLLAGGANPQVLNAAIAVTCPVRILHGMNDADVPWQLSLELTQRLAAQDIHLTFLKSGDHRLSTEADLTLLEQTLAGLL